MGFKETAERIRKDLERYYAWSEEKVAAIGEEAYWRTVRKLEDDAEHFERLAGKYGGKRK